jgi:oligoendopeptidase F
MCIRDREKAVESYLNALRLGGMASLPDLFRTAGAKFAFNAGTLKKAVKLIEQKILELEKN